MSSLSDVSLVVVQMETRATSSSAYKGHVACAKKLIDLCQEWDSNPCPSGPVPETGALDQLGHLDMLMPILGWVSWAEELLLVAIN
jgi:hypothetical protein